MPWASCSFRWSSRTSTTARRFVLSFHHSPWQLKCENNLNLIFKDLLGFPVTQIQFDEARLHKRELITIAKKLEGKLFDRIFSYFPPMNPDETRKFLQHTAKHMLINSLKTSLDKLPEQIVEEPQSPTSFNTPSKIQLRRQNSAFKTHVSERKTG